MPTLTKTNYEAEGIALLRQGQRGRPLVEGLVQIGLAQVQELELAIQQLTSPYDIGSATGDRLDQLGMVFGVPRSGLPDASYRLLLLGKLAASRSNGLLSDLETASATLFQAAPVYIYAPTSDGAGPAAPGGGVGVMVGSPNLPQELFSLAKKLLIQCLPAGVSLLFLGSFDANKALAFDSAQPYVQGFDSGLFADLTP